MSTTLTPPRRAGVCAPLEDARRPLAEPADHRARQHDPQRRAALAPGSAGRERLDAAVDRRLLPARLRRAAADIRRLRRPFRAPAARSSSASRSSASRASPCSFVDSSTGLIAVRALMGVGGALIMPATLSIITNTFPREERAKAIGIWAAFAAVGIGLGPLAGGLLLEWFSWRSVFLVNVPVAAPRSCSRSGSCRRAATPIRARFDFAGAASRSRARLARLHDHRGTEPRLARAVTLGGFASRSRSSLPSSPGSCAWRSRC